MRRPFLFRGAAARACLAPGSDAPSRERARNPVGQPEVRLEIADGSMTPALVEALESAYPQLAQILPRCALAVNGEYVHGPAVLAEGNEVAVLPPMSGG